jgi:hypothetical protein
MSLPHPFAFATFMMYRRTLARSSGVLGLARPTADIAAWSVFGPGPRPSIGNRGSSLSLLADGGMACPRALRRWSCS